MTLQVLLARDALKSLKRSNKRELISSKIAELAASPFALSANIIKLQGRDGYRLRIQDWRVIFRVDDDILYVMRIEPRGSAYED